MDSALAITTHHMNIVVIGFSRHAKCVIDSVELAGRFRVVDLIDDYQTTGKKAGSHRVPGTIGKIANLVGVHQLDRFIVAIGDKSARAALTAKM